MSTSNHGIRYDENFKHTLVNLYQSGGKTQATLQKEYGIAPITLNRWIKQYSTVETDDGEVLTAKQVKELQKRMAQLEEENLILKKAIAIFTPHSNNDQKLFISYAPNITSNSFVRCWVSTEAPITNIIIQNQPFECKKTNKSQNRFFRFMQIITSGLVLIKSPMFFSVIMA